MKSVRLDESLEQRLDAVARITGRPVSEIIREALRAHCDELLGTRLDMRLGDVVGAVRGGGSSRSTGRAFTAAIKSRQPRRKKKQ